MNKINQIYFSPTNTTKTILDAIIDGFKPIENIITDITPCKENYTFPESDLVVIGIPVYAGRLPEIVLSRLENLKGNNTPAVIIAVYGNRHFDDALLELSDIMTSKGFKVFAAGTFIGEHSFSSEIYPIAAHRPDDSDLEKAINFGKDLKQLLSNDITLTKTLIIPGNNPYKDAPGKNSVAPVTNSDLCNKCMACIDVCPTNAIPNDNPLISDGKKCILCSACIKVCTQKARIFEAEGVVNSTIKLNKLFSERREPELLTV